MKTTAEKQKFYLQHQWDLLEVQKGYRMRVPFIIGSINIGVTSFVLNSEKIPQSIYEKVALALMLVIITGAGIIVLRQVQSQYMHFLHKIKYLYDRMGISGPDFYDEKAPSVLTGTNFFNAIYVVTTLVGLLCAATIIMMPVRH
jgi:hypothetical protein